MEREDEGVYMNIRLLTSVLMLILFFTAPVSADDKEVVGDTSIAQPLNNIDQEKLNRWSRWKGHIFIGEKPLHGAGSRALYQLLKIEYFSDLCQYEIFKDKQLRERMGIKEGFGSFTQQCLAKQVMPNDCRLLQEHILRFAQMAALLDGDFSFFFHFQRRLSNCISKNWVDKNWFINEHNIFPSPIEWFLWRKQTPETGPLISKAKAEYISKVTMFNGHRPPPDPPSSLYFGTRCGLNKGAITAEEIDLIICRSKPSMEPQSWVRFLEENGVGNATDK